MQRFSLLLSLAVAVATLSSACGASLLHERWSPEQKAAVDKAFDKCKQMQGDAEDGRTFDCGVQLFNMRVVAQHNHKEAVDAAVAEANEYGMYGLVANAKHGPQEWDGATLETSTIKFKPKEGEMGNGSTLIFASQKVEDKLQLFRCWYSHGLTLNPAEDLPKREAFCTSGLQTLAKATR